MTEQQHVPIEDLAAFAAGDLDAAAAVTVEAHVVLCAECRSDVEAVRAATVALASVPAVTMPADVATRLDETLAGLGSPSREPAGTVLPMASRRKRPSFAAVAAVAAGVALVAAISIPFVTGAGPKDGTPSAVSAPEAAGGDLARQATRQLSSGLDYRRDTLVVTLNSALAGSRNPVAAPNADTAGSPASGPAPAYGGTSESVTLSKLRSEPPRLAACVEALVGDQPPAGKALLVVDYARFEGRDAVVLVFPSVTSEGTPRENRVDVFVVGPGCGTDPGGDLLDFQRIAVPSQLQ